jgi:hypothetical protein
MSEIFTTTTLPVFVIVATMLLVCVGVSSMLGGERRATRTTRRSPIVTRTGTHSQTIEVVNGVTLINGYPVRGNKDQDRIDIMQDGSKVYVAGRRRILYRNEWVDPRSVTA